MTKFAFAIGVVVLLIVLIALMISTSGCTMFAKDPGITLPSLPTSGAESMFKTLARTNWAIIGCLALFAAGMMLVMLKFKNLGAACIVTSIATTMYSLALHRFPTIMAIIGLVGMLGYAGYKLYYKAKALHEVVEGNEKLKVINQLAENHLGAIQNTVQSPSTKKLVDKIQKKLNGKEKNSD